MRVQECSLSYAVHRSQLAPRISGAYGFYRRGTPSQLSLNGCHGGNSYACGDQTETGVEMLTYLTDPQTSAHSAVSSSMGRAASLKIMDDSEDSPAAAMLRES